MNELVSVIMPTYKGADKIERAIESVINQTYKNIELIVVDDNGKNTEQQLRTEEVMVKYKDMENIFYIVHDVNKNGAAARNTAIKIAKGKYLCFLDDDDIFAPQKIQKQVEAFENLTPEYGMVFGGVKEIDMQGRIEHRSAYFEGDFLYKFLCDEVVACSSTVMIKAEVMDVVKEWDESFKRHQDWEFFARVADMCKVGYVDCTCVEKYRYDNNLPKDGTVTEKYRMHYLKKIKYIIDKYPEKQQNDVYDHHYIDVGKVYIKNGDIKNALRMAGKTSNVIKAYFAYLKDGLVYINKKMCKR